jgi:hypothetical protein
MDLTIEILKVISPTSLVIALISIISMIIGKKIDLSNAKELELFKYNLMNIKKAESNSIKIKRLHYRLSETSSRIEKRFYIKNNNKSSGKKNLKYRKFRIIAKKIFIISSFIMIVAFILLVVLNIISQSNNTVPTGETTSITQNSDLEAAIVAGEYLDNGLLSTAIFTKLNSDDESLGNVFTIKYIENIGEQKVEKIYFVTTFKSLLNVFNNNKNFKIKFKDHASLTSTDLMLVGYSPLYNIAVLEVNTESGEFSALNLSETEANIYDAISVPSKGDGIITATDLSNELTMRIEFLTDIDGEGLAGMPVLDLNGNVLAIVTDFTDISGKAIAIPNKDLISVLEVIPALEHFPVEELPERFPYNYYDRGDYERAKTGFFDTEFEFNKYDISYTLDNENVCIISNETEVSLYDNIADKMCWTNGIIIRYGKTGLSNGGHPPLKYDSYYFTYNLDDGYGGLNKSIDEMSDSIKSIDYNFTYGYLLLSNNTQTDLLYVDPERIATSDNAKYIVFSTNDGLIRNEESGEIITLPEYITYLISEAENIPIDQYNSLTNQKIHRIINSKTQSEAGIADYCYYITSDDLSGYFTGESMTLSKHTDDLPFSFYVEDNLSAVFTRNYRKLLFENDDLLELYDIDLWYQNTPSSTCNIVADLVTEENKYVEIKINQNGLIAHKWDNGDISIYDMNYDDDGISISDVKTEPRFMTGVYYNIKYNYLFVGNMLEDKRTSLSGVVMSNYGFLVGEFDNIELENCSVYPFALTP